jgi:hypothetical protein
MYYLYERTIGILIKGNGKKKEQQKRCALTRIRPLVSTPSQQKNSWVTQRITDLDRLDAEHRHL